MGLGLLARELAFLVVLWLLGAGPAALLPVDSPIVRWAVAPAMGLAVGAAGLTTLSFFTPLEHALWFAVVPMILASCLLALRLRRRVFVPPARSEVLAGVAVLGFSLLVFSFPMLARNSLGPVGYGIFDGPGYSAYIDGYQRYASDEPPLAVSPRDWADPRWDRVAWGKPWDLVARYGWAYKFQHTASDTIPAVLSGATGWPPWTLVTPFMAALAAVGALGTFALARLLLQGQGPLASVAGILFSGPVLLQIHIDGSQGFMAGVALVPSLLISGIAVVSDPSWRSGIASGLLLAGLQAVYPELLPIIGATASVGLGAGAVILRARKRWVPARVRKVMLTVAAAAVLALVLSPRTTPWTAHYLYGVVTGTGMGLLGSLIDYQLSLDYIPSWLAQTREFYSFAVGGTAPRDDLLRDVVTPLSVAAVIIIGVTVRPRARLLLPMVLAVGVQALGLAVSVGCSYCVQRSLLSLIPVLPVLFVAGVSCLWAGGKAARLALVVLIPIVGVGVGQTLVATQRRAVEGAYMATGDLATLAGHVRRLPDRQPLLIEGFNAMPLWSWADLPTAYGAMRHGSDRRVSVAAEYNDYGGFSYLGTRPRDHPAFTPGYGWVVTRFGALDTGRETVARRGPLALQRRSQPFDVTVVRGVAIAPPTLDRAGVPWVQAPGRQVGLEQGPLTLWVSGPWDQPAWVELRLAAPPETEIMGPPGTTHYRAADGALVACALVPGDGALRVLTLDINPPPPGLQAPPGALSTTPLPATLIRLDKVRASGQTCTAPFGR